MTTPQTSEERFWSMVDATGDCWIWTGATDADGYGRIGGRSAHRRSWLTLVGPVSDGLQLDHLCRVRRCVNPAHMEPVTSRENTRRGFRGAPRLGKPRWACVNGHPFDEANTYLHRGVKYCRACNRAAQRRLKDRRLSL